MEMFNYPTQYKQLSFNAPNDVEKSGGIMLLRIGRRIAKPAYSLGPSREALFFVNFLLEGSLRFEYGGNEITLYKGDMFCMFPHHPSRFSVHNPEPPPQMKWLTCDGPQVIHLLRSIGMTPELPYKRKVLSHQVLQAVEDVFAKFGSKHTEAHLSMLGSLYKLFSLLSATTAPSVHEPSRELIQRCQEFMQLHFTVNITVKQVAEFAGLHWAYFSKLFREHAGMSPGKYIQQLKMKRAAELLIGSALTISDIADSLGFNDLYSFSRAFRNYHSQSPRSYRDDSRK